MNQPSEETWKKIAEFFLKTSVPRILRKQQIKREEIKKDQGNDLP